MSTPTPAGETPVMRARVPAELVEAARLAYGRPDATDSALIRAGLAALAGLPVSEYTSRLPAYRPRQHNRAA